jgi:hypothetical protein
VTANSSPNGVLRPGPGLYSVPPAAIFTITPNVGYTTDNIITSCGAPSLSNTQTLTALPGIYSYTIPANIPGDCSFTPTFVPANTVYRMALAVDPAGGTISPTPGIYGVNPGPLNYQQITITPRAGYSVANVADTCGGGGTLSGNVYTTGHIGSDCVINVIFSASCTP